MLANPFADKRYELLYKTREGILWILNLEKK